MDETRAWNWDAIRRRCAVEARRIMRDAAEADDVVQEAMMRAWARRRMCNEPQAPIPWCLQITRHEAYRRLARRPGQREQPLDELWERPTADPSDADRVIDRVDIRRALDRLEPDQQVLVALRYAHDYTQPQIARTLNIPEGTAKVRLYRVRKQLATMID